jgi:ATP-binding cassette subfamily B protein
VPQDVFLFAGNILENIRLGHPEITSADAQAAAAELHLDRITRRLPGGLREPVRERGKNLSSGERQLIAFARVLAVAPAVLALDEATSNVDSEMEHLLQEAVHKLMEGRTSLIIAHRLSTIRDVDRILVMHKGELVEEGNHDELLAKQGFYWRLHQLQYANVE